MRRMLTDTSSQLADVVDAAAPSVVQVRAGGRASSGIVYDTGLVLTTGRAIGRDEHPEIRDSAGRAFAADLAGWDPASRLVLLKVPELSAPAITPGALPRVGSLAVALGRSLSNNI